MNFRLLGDEARLALLIRKMGLTSQKGWDTIVTEYEKDEKTYSGEVGYGLAGHALPAAPGGSRGSIMPSGQ